MSRSIAALARVLMESPLQELVQTLAEISSILYEKSSTGAEIHLRKRFCSKQTIEAICPLDDAETVNYLFPYNALYILNTILTCYELLLIAVQNGIDLHSIFKKLSSLPPSETRRAIVRIMQEAGLKVSVHSLYERVIKELQDKCKAMLVL